MLEKAGLVLEGRMRSHLLIRGAWRDSLLYAQSSYPVTSHVPFYLPTHGHDQGLKPLPALRPPHTAAGYLTASLRISRLVEHQQLPRASPPQHVGSDAAPRRTHLLSLIEILPSTRHWRRCQLE